MNILIINMPIRVTSPPNNVPLGIYYLSSIIKKYFPEETVKVLDLNIRRPLLSMEEISKIIDFSKYDLLCLSGLITTYKWQVNIIKLARKYNPNIQIISGGGLASDVPELLHQYNVSTNIGEGDETIYYIIQDAKNNKLKKTYKSNIIASKKSKFKSLDDIPFPDYNNIEMIEEYIKIPIWGIGSNNSSNTSFNLDRSLSIITSRGCPYSCRFCDKIITGGNNYRFRSPKNVLEEVRYLKEKYNIDFIGFIDDNFAVNKTRLNEMCKGLKELNINWGGHARFNDLKDENIVKLLSESGCKYIGFGGESGNIDILNDMKKGNNLEEMIKVLSLCKKYNIHANCTWIMGWPKETLKQIQDTIKFILEYAPENRNIFTATAYPGTDLFDSVKDIILTKFKTIEQYVIQLDDATKNIINYSKIEDNFFDHIRIMLENDKLEDILLL
jgi:radical SAM superfamily enzyme YgiQ (UPF0313 family)